jgi:hypothetical protein
LVVGGMLAAPPKASAQSYSYWAFMFLTAADDYAHEGDWKNASEFGDLGVWYAWSDWTSSDDVYAFYAMHDGGEGVDYAAFVLYYDDPDYKSKAISYLDSAVYYASLRFYYDF